MSDIYCPRCGEPWDMDQLHDEIDERMDSGAFKPIRCPESGLHSGNAAYVEYRAAYDRYYGIVRADFRRLGCGAFSWSTPCEATGSSVAHASAVLMDAFGDDMDGVASDMADALQLGLI